MNTMNIDTLKQVLLASLAITSLALSSNLKADQPTEPVENIKLFGVVNTIDNQRNIKHLQPSSSSVTQQHNSGLTTVVLSQTFVNSNDHAVQGYYHLPLPNPAALLNYHVSSNKSAMPLEDPQQLHLKQGESITYEVRYELMTDQLVGFHQTGDLGLDYELNATNIAQR